MAGAIALIDRYHPVLIFEFSPEHTSEIGNDWDDTVGTPVGHAGPVR